MDEANRGAVRYYLSLGSNIRPVVNMRAAAARLAADAELVGYSSVYRSAPAGGEAPQPDYLNAVVAVESKLDPQSFQDEVVSKIEAALGRVRTGDPYAPRTIDIDIILVGENVMQINHREIPSPEILERAFVAVPLAEVAPDLVHPVDGRTMTEIAAGLEGDEMVRTAFGLY